MIAEIFLGVVTLAFIAGHFWYVREKNVETKKLINALVAKTPEQARDMDFVDKVKVETDSKQQEPDLVPLVDMSDEDFDKHIEEINNG